MEEEIDVIECLRRAREDSGFMGRLRELRVFNDLSAMFDDAETLVNAGYTESHLRGLCVIDNAQKNRIYLAVSNFLRRSILIVASILRYAGRGVALNGLLTIFEWDAHDPILQFLFEVGSGMIYELWVNDVATILPHMRHLESLQTIHVATQWTPPDLTALARTAFPSLHTLHVHLMSATCGMPATFELPGTITCLRMQSICRPEDVSSFADALAAIPLEELVLDFGLNYPRAEYLRIIDTVSATLTALSLNRHADAAILTRVSVFPRLASLTVHDLDLVAPLDLSALPLRKLCLTVRSGVRYLPSLLRSLGRPTNQMELLLIDITNCGGMTTRECDADEILAAAMEGLDGTTRLKTLHLHMPPPTLDCEDATWPAFSLPSLIAAERNHLRRHAATLTTLGLGCIRATDLESLARLVDAFATHYDSLGLLNLPVMSISVANLPSDEMLHSWQDIDGFFAPLLAAVHGASPITSLSMTEPGTRLRSKTGPACAWSIYGDYYDRAIKRDMFSAPRSRREYLRWKREGEAADEDLHAWEETARRIAAIQERRITTSAFRNSASCNGDGVCGRCRAGGDGVCGRCRAGGDGVSTSPLAPAEALPPRALRCVAEYLRRRGGRPGWRRGSLLGVEASGCSYTSVHAAVPTFPFVNCSGCDVIRHLDQPF
jgi:hypothetical protein